MSLSERAERNIIIDRLGSGAVICNIAGEGEAIRASGARIDDVGRRGRVERNACHVVRGGCHQVVN